MTLNENMQISKTDFNVTLPNIPTKYGTKFDLTAILEMLEGQPHKPPINVAGLEFLIDGVFLTAVSIFGIIGTLMSIRVLIIPQLKSHAFSALLVYLAICDANFLFFAVLTIGLPEVSTW